MREEGHAQSSHLWKRSPESALLHERLDRALSQLWVAFQPIYSHSARRVIGYEALLRTDSPTVANPIEFLQLANLLNRDAEPGRSARRRAAAFAKRLPSDTRVFVNLQASDLLDEDLFLPTSPLSQVADRVVLELTEWATMDDVPDLRERLRRLRELGFSIAIDDLGAGHNGLNMIPSDRRCASFWPISSSASATATASGTRATCRRAWSTWSSAKLSPASSAATPALASSCLRMFGM